LPRQGSCVRAVARLLAPTTRPVLSGYDRVVGARTPVKNRHVADESVAPICRRCGRPVAVSRNQYDVFEGMHYVCFHYEFEHHPVDPDEECGAGGCPSAAVNPRLDRRPERRV
jgi:hypothetical protein